MREGDLRFLSDRSANVINLAIEGCGVYGRGDLGPPPLVRAILWRVDSFALDVSRVPEQGLVT
jgi:hypothetical protein